MGYSQKPGLGQLKLEISWRLWEHGTVAQKRDRKALDLDLDSNTECVPRVSVSVSPFIECVESGSLRSPTLCLPLMWCSHPSTPPTSLFLGDENTDTRRQTRLNGIFRRLEARTTHFLFPSPISGIPEGQGWWRRCRCLYSAECAV